MSNSNVVRLPKVKTEANAAKRSAGMRKKMKRQATAAVCIGGVAVVLTSLSLSHLAHGIHLVTNSAIWEAWAMAVGIDCGFIALELSMLMVSTEVMRRKLARYANPGIVGTLAGSALLNALAFAFGANGLLMQTIAASIGIAIPCMVYALTKVGAMMYMDHHNKG